MSLLLQPSGGIAFPQNDIMLEDLPSAQDPNGLLSGGATVSDDAGAHSIDASSHARINDNETSWRINGQANIASNDTNIHPNGADDHASVHHIGTTISPSSTTNIPPNPGSLPRPVAICGMALRLPGGLESPQELWEFLLEKGDARCQVPKSRYNIDAYHSKSGRTGTIATQYGYFLDESIKLGGLDTSRFSLSRAELEVVDPQHRRMLEVVREVFDDAGEIDFKVSFKVSLLDSIQVLINRLSPKTLAATWGAMVKTGWRCKTGTTNKQASTGQMATAISCSPVEYHTRWISRAHGT